LYIGSIGKEWVVDGETKHFLPNLIKVVDKNFNYQTKNWTHVYEKLRVATNTTFPGYLQHEAVFWDTDLKTWMFLPRKASETVPYDEVTDELHGTNLLIQMNYWEKVVNVSRFGPLEKEYGFSSFKKIPKSMHHYVVLKTRETSTPEKIIHTKMAIIDLQGNMKSGKILIPSSRMV
jgi:soluble calcium-activated nucleotidase 1